MQRLTSAALAIALVCLLAPADSAAQVGLYVGGGPTFPSSDYGKYAKTGYLGYAGVQLPIGAAGLAVSANGYYGSNNHENSDDKTNLYGALAGLAYQFDTGTGLSPSIFGLIGSMTHQYKPSTGDSSSETKVAYGGGAQLGFPLGPIGGFVNAWYVTASFDEAGVSARTAVTGISAGLSFILGG